METLDQRQILDRFFFETIRFHHPPSEEPLWGDSFKTGLADRLFKIAWALINENVGHVLVFAYLLAVGEAGFVMVGPPLIISALLLVLFIAYFRKAIEQLSEQIKNYKTFTLHQSTCEQVERFFLIQYFITFRSDHSPLSTK